jgi:hypothetical protein
MWFRLTVLICLGILFVGGITVIRIDNVSAPIRITDDPPPKVSVDQSITATPIEDKNAVKVNSKAVNKQKRVKVKSQSQTGATTINQK